MAIASKSIVDAAPVYDAVVVGSGYGGGVTASRLARMGFKVAVIERGRQWRPGAFPATNAARRKTVRLAGRAPKWGDPVGLYYFSVGHGLTVFGASGLGGGSLINAGVTLRPDPARLRKWGWPEAVVGDGLLVKGFERAERMLGTSRVPEPDRFMKFAGMRRMAEAAGCTVQGTSMTISHAPGQTAADVIQYGCRTCGDCWSGCNAGAKITTGITYIADAVDHGGEVFCEARVQSIAKIERGWRVIIEDMAHRGLTRRIEAGIVVLAAGTLGTNEIMMRSRQGGLALSTKLGEKFSANGDDLVIASEFDPPVNAVATGYPIQAPRGVPPVGPHSMAVIDLGDEQGPVWVHDGTMTTVMAAMAPLEQFLQLRIWNGLKLIKEGRYGDDLSRSQLLYVVAHDDASGRLTFVKDDVVVEWPGYSDKPERIRAEQKAKAMIEGAGAVFSSNPFTMKAFGGNRIIAHPLGGCAMGETVETGVVASDGRVFDPTQGPTGVHDGLYVCDAAAIPASVGVSPLLTISGLAERAMMLAAERLGRRLDVDTKPVRPLRDAAM